MSFRYTGRINDTLEYVESHLNEKLTLKKLADIAHFSPYHFHRIFRSYVGETVHEYIMRKKLSSAVHDLIFSEEKPLTDIAYDAGFTSQSDFSRAFRRKYNMNPHEFRNQRQRECTAIKNGQYLIKKGGRIYPVKIDYEFEDQLRTIELDNIKAAYINCLGLSKKLNTPKILAAYNKLQKWAIAEKFYHHRSQFFGVRNDYPGFTPLKQCSYLACIPVPENKKPYKEIRIKTLHTKGKYITFRYSRSGEHFYKKHYAYLSYLLSAWFPGNLLVPAKKPLLEFYHTDSNNESVAVVHVPFTC